MLMQKKHIDDIKIGLKTETRRRISRYKKGPKKGKIVPPLKIGSIQPCKEKMYGPTLAYIKILDRWCERLGDISCESASNEGGYSREDYIDGLIKMYNDEIDENEVLWVYTIQYVGDERPKGE